MAFEVNITSLSELMLEYDKNRCQEKKEIKKDTSVTDSSRILPDSFIFCFPLWSLNTKMMFTLKK